MNEVMMIQGTAIQIKEYRGKRVVTFKDIDTVHKRSDGTASRNFRENRQRFIGGVDFFKVTQPDEIRRLGITRPQGGIPNEIILVTETGYLMLVKSFNDDLAWKVQRELVDTYFRARMEPDEDNVKEIIESGVPTVVIATDKLIKCAEIMAGCLEGNRPYVLNILKNIVPNIEEQKDLTTPVVTEDTVAEVPDVTEKTVMRKNPCKGVHIDIQKMLEEMSNQNMTVKELARKAQISPHTIGNWVAGVTEPLLQNRINICVALGKDQDFLTPKRRRKTK